MPEPVSQSEIRTAIDLWNDLKPAELQDGEKRKKDPFGGYLGRSNAAAMNFLLFATACRVWNTASFEKPLSRMLNHVTKEVGFEVNKGHIPRLIEGYAEKAKKGTGIVFVGTTKAVDWIDKSRKSFCLNPDLQKEPEIQQFRYFNAAIALDSQAAKDQLRSLERVKTEYDGLDREKKQTVDAAAITPRYLSDLQEIVADTSIPPTTRQTLVEARLGQGKFRVDVLARWNDACAVTGSKTVAAIRASHIKPWSESEPDERLDASNGLPLVANLDALFDRGLISFADSSAMLVSEQLNSEEQELFGLVDARLRQALSERMKQFMRFHRARHGFGD